MGFGGAGRLISDRFSITRPRTIYNRDRLARYVDSFAKLYKGFDFDDLT